MTKERIAKAMADYERTRMSGNSPYDRWRRQRDAGAVSGRGQAGHDLFYGKGACNQCHVGSRFTDNTFHNIGIGWNAATKTFADEGRFDGNEGGSDADRGAFKTPTLRDVARARALHARRLDGRRCARSSSTTTAAATRIRTWIRRCRARRWG